jgi:hypothetical protein
MFFFSFKNEQTVIEEFMLKQKLGNNTQNEKTTDPTKQTKI